MASANCKYPEFTAAGLTENNDYYFRVSACNEVGASEPVKTKDAIKAAYPFGALNGVYQGLGSVQALPARWVG